MSELREDRPNKRARVDDSIVDGVGASTLDLTGTQKGRQGQTQRSAHVGNHSDDKIEIKDQARISELGSGHNTHKGEQQKKYDEGMCVFKDHIPIEGDVNESSRSVAMMYNAGQTQVRQGNYFQAIRWFELASLQLNMDVNLAETLNLSVRINHNLGHCHYRLGNNENAMRFFKIVLEHAQDPSLEEMNLVEASTLNCIGVLSFHSKVLDLSEPLAMLEKSLTVYETHLSDESSKIATVLNNIGRVHYEKGDYQKALNVYERALAIRRGQLGDHSVDVAVTIYNVGRTHHQRRELDKAMRYYQEFLQLANIHHGSIDRHVVAVTKCIADIHYQWKELDKAREMYEEALRHARSLLGSFHPDTISTLDKLGKLYYDMKSDDMALKHYMESLKIQKAVLDACHPNVIMTLTNIAQVYRQRGDLHAAFLVFTEVHTRTFKAYGSNSLQVANALSNVGLIQFQLQDHETACYRYQEALQIQRDNYGSDENTDVASSLNSIGLILFKQGFHDAAKDCFCDSLRIRRKILGPNHRDVAVICYNLATVHLETGDDELAIKYYKETLRVEQMTNQQDAVMTLQNLGLVHQQRGELEEALIYFGEALEIEAAKVGNGREAAVKLLNLMGNMHLQTANVGEMMTCFTEACRIYRERDGQPHHALKISGYNFYDMSKVHPPGAPMA
jgi:tetratricopeptide (TPR) repeat protein